VTRGVIGPSLAMPSAAFAALAPAVASARFARALRPRGFFRQPLHDLALNRQPGQFLDRRDAFFVSRAHQHEGMANSSRTTRTPDAMDVIVRLEGYVEIEDVTYRGNVETARGDVAGHQNRDLAGAERLECARPYRLVQIAMQG
jgi:hypothetical protein